MPSSSSSSNSSWPSSGVATGSREGAPPGGAGGNARSKDAAEAAEAVAAVREDVGALGPGSGPPAGSSGRRRLSEYLGRRQVGAPASLFACVFEGLSGRHQLGAHASLFALYFRGLAREAQCTSACTVHRYERTLGPAACGPAKQGTSCSPMPFPHPCCSHHQRTFPLFDKYIWHCSAQCVKETCWVTDFVIHTLCAVEYATVGARGYLQYLAPVCMENCHWQQAPLSRLLSTVTYLGWVWLLSGTSI